MSTGSRETCSSSSSIQATQLPTGYLSSIIADETNCGSRDCPWKVAVPSGQRIRISLLDFATSSRLPSDFIHDIPKVCHVYAVVRENSIGASETVCGSNTRNNMVYTSMTNQLEIRITTTAPQKDDEDEGRYFLLKYTGEGSMTVSAARVQLYKRCAWTHFAPILRQNRAYVCWARKEKQAPLNWPGTEFWTCHAAAAGPVLPKSLRAQVAGIVGCLLS